MTGYHTRTVNGTLVWLSTYTLYTWRDNQWSNAISGVSIVSRPPKTSARLPLNTRLHGDHRPKRNPTIDSVTGRVACALIPGHRPLSTQYTTITHHWLDGFSLVAWFEDFPSVISPFPTAPPPRYQPTKLLSPWQPSLLTTHALTTTINALPLPRSASKKTVL